MEAFDHVPGKKVSWGYWASLDQADGKPFLVQMTFVGLCQKYAHIPYVCLCGLTTAVPCPPETHPQNLQSPEGVFEKSLV